MGQTHFNSGETNVVGIFGLDPHGADHPGPTNGLRYPVRKLVSYEYRGKRYLTLTLELGLDGMVIETNHGFPRDGHLTMQLILGKQSIAIKGRVVRSQLLSDMTILSDIQFLESSEQSWELLGDYLRFLDR
jgi:hypothetical protein